MTALDLLADVISALDAAGVPYMVVGSTASSYHGAPRATQDIDLVIDPTAAELARFLGLVESPRYYVDRQGATGALVTRDQFNVIDPKTGWKIDLIIRKDRAFSRIEMSRRIRAEVLGVPVLVATAEDTILAKLEWGAAGDSERQARDVATLLALRADLDDAYLDEWAPRLGVEVLLARARLLASE